MVWAGHSRCSITLKFIPLSKSWLESVVVVDSMDFLWVVRQGSNAARGTFSESSQNFCFSWELWGRRQWSGQTTKLYVIHVYTYTKHETLTFNKPSLITIVVLHGVPPRYRSISNCMSTGSPIIRYPFLSMPSDIRIVILVLISEFGSTSKEEKEPAARIATYWGRLQRISWKAYTRKIVKKSGYWFRRRIDYRVPYRSV